MLSCWTNYNQPTIIVAKLLKILNTYCLRLAYNSVQLSLTLETPILILGSIFAWNAYLKYVVVKKIHSVSAVK